MPSARLISSPGRRRRHRADSGDRKPGAANVARTLGWKPAWRRSASTSSRASAGRRHRRAVPAPAPTWRARSPSRRWSPTSPWCAAAAPPPRSAPRWPSTRRRPRSSCRPWSAGPSPSAPRLGAMVAALGLPLASLALGHRRRAPGAAGPAGDHGLRPPARLRRRGGGRASLAVAWERFWFDREPGGATQAEPPRRRAPRRTSRSPRTDAS